MLWVKSLHLIFMVTWFAGLFYLPRLFVYHAQAGDRISLERFKVMERKLFWGIMTPGAVLTIVFGVWLWLGWFRPATGWLHAKIALVALLAGYHLWCWRLLRDFAAERNQRSHVWLRWFNEFPTLPPRRGASKRCCRKRFPLWEEQTRSWSLAAYRSAGPGRPATARTSGRALPPGCCGRSTSSSTAMRTTSTRR